MTPASLKKWRKKRELRQVDAADALGVSRRTYQDMEAGAAPIHKHIGLACAAISHDLTWKDA